MAERNAWKDAVLDAAVCNWTYTKEMEDNPQLAMRRLLDWTTQVALDPAVSEPAAKLHARIAELEDEKRALEADKDVLMEQGEAIARQRDAAGQQAARELESAVREISACTAFCIDSNSGHEARQRAMLAWGRVANALAALRAPEGNHGP